MKTKQCKVREIKEIHGGKMTHCGVNGKGFQMMERQQNQSATIAGVMVELL